MSFRGSCFQSRVRGTEGSASMSAVGHSGIMREGGGAIVTRGRGAVVMGCQRVASRSVILSTGTPLLSLYNLLLSFPQLGLAKSRRAPCTLKRPREEPYKQRTPGHHNDKKSHNTASLSRVSPKGTHAPITKREDISQTAHGAVERRCLASDSPAAPPVCQT